MHVRSRTTIDPRIPPMTERATSGFHRPDRRCLRQAQSAVSRWASRMKDELHPTKNHFWGGFSSILCIYIFVIGITFQLILLVGGLAITDLQDKPWSQVSSLLPPQFVAVFFAHRVQRSHCSSVLIGCCSLTLSRLKLIFFLCKNYLRVCTWWDLSSQNGYWWARGQPTKPPWQRQWIDMFSGVTTPRDSNGFTTWLPRGCLTMYTLRDTIIPLVRSWGSPRTKIIWLRPPAGVTAETANKQTNKQTNQQTNKHTNKRYLLEMILVSSHHIRYSITLTSSGIHLCILGTTDSFPVWVIVG